MTKRHMSAVSLSAIIGLCLTQFQNCAPARSIASGDATVDYTDARVGVDTRGATDLQFALSKVELKDEAATAAIGGLCARAHEGERIRLSLVDGVQPLVTALGVCARGQFQVKLEAMNNLACGVSHQLVAEGEWGGSAAVSFLRRCQPVLSEVVDAVDAPYGTTCQFEYTPGSANACQRVCYRLDQVINSTTLDQSSCAGMATQLAGP